MFSKDKGYFSVHYRNIQSLALEILQREHDWYHEMTSDIFTQTKEECNFSESTFYLGPKIWKIISVTRNQYLKPCRLTSGEIRKGANIVFKILF